jgi:hypothetical protein
MKMCPKFAEPVVRRYNLQVTSSIGENRRSLIKYGRLNQPYARTHIFWFIKAPAATLTVVYY